MRNKPNLKRIAEATDQVRTAAEEMVQSPLWFIEQILIKHETAVMEVMKELNEEVQTLRTRLAEVEKDAARYRWMRRPDNVTMDTWVLTLSNEKLDAAIDAAMKEHP